MIGGLSRERTHLGPIWASFGSVAILTSVDFWVAYNTADKADSCWAIFGSLPAFYLALSACERARHLELTPTFDLLNLSWNNEGTGLTWP